MYHIFRALLHIFINIFIQEAVGLTFNEGGIKDCIPVTHYQELHGIEPVEPH